MPDERVPVILDTDIGDDIDDAWALSVCLRHPDIKLLGVTTVHRDTELRAAEARLLIEAAGAEGVEVAAGTRDGLDRLFELHRNCQADALSAEDEARLRPGRTDAVRFLAETIEANPGCTLLPIGPFTNVGRLVVEFPEAFAKLGRLVVMGGHVMPDRQDPEYNALVDPRATRIMFESGKPLRMIGLDVTLRCVMEPGDLEAIEAKGTPLSRAIMTMTRLWQKPATDAGHPPHMPCVHDPLAALSCAEPDVVKTEPMCLRIDDAGRCLRVADEPNAEVAVDVNPVRVRQRVVEFIG
jgi:inosine-uridine nucleoside N-ribohydrolase